MLIDSMKWKTNLNNNNLTSSDIQGREGCIDRSREEKEKLLLENKQSDSIIEE